jgi:RimJ/RimL family protein N-acetyltransferase
MKTFDKLPIHCKRLVLRPLCAADAPGLLRISSDPEGMRYWSGPPWATLDQAHSMIEHGARGITTGDQLRLGIEIIEGAVLAGTCTLFNINDSCRRVEIGYGLHPSAWGRGYMNEALAALIAYGFENRQFNRIEADIDPKNGASARCLERLHFIKEGYLRERWIVGGQVSDTALYGLLRSDWASASRSTPHPSGIARHTN